MQLCMAIEENGTLSENVEVSLDYVRSHIYATRIDPSRGSATTYRLRSFLMSFLIFEDAQGINITNNSSKRTTDRQYNSSYL